MFNLTDNSINSQVFYTKGVADYQVWTKPANAKFVSIFCLGSGGGGGGGMVGTATTARRGGGGGGSGGFSIGTFSAIQLPNNLFLSVAPGGSAGAGGASPTSGGAGALSYVSVQPNNTAINLLLVSGAVAATGGTSGGGGGNAGVGSTAWAGNILNYLGLATAVAGTNGGAGAISSLAISITPTTIVCGGPSGGNTNASSAAYDGGDVIGSGFLDTIHGGALGSGATAGGNGSDGVLPNLSSPNKNTPTFFTAGSGGGGSVSGQGGNGGSGSYGCGGAGGGAGFTGLAGQGGRGGDGLIIITAW